MFCEPKDQELNTFICSIYVVNFLTPLGPLGVRPYRFEKKVSHLAVCKSNVTHLSMETQ